jgi:hypothetical protein
MTAWRYTVLIISVQCDMNPFRQTSVSLTFVSVARLS